MNKPLPATPAPSPVHRYRSAAGPAVRGSLFYLGYWGVVGIFFPFLNVRFERLGLTESQIGLLAALMPSATLFFAPAVSALADRHGWRVRALAVALPGMALTLLAVGAAREFVPIFALMVAFALFRAPVTPLADALIVRMAQRHRLDYGRMRLWGSLGFALLTVAFGAVWQRLGFDAMFAVAAVLLLPIALAAAGLEETERVEPAERRPLREVGRDRGLVAVLLATFLVGAAVGTGFVFEGIYMDRLGGGAFLIGALFGASAISELPAMRYGGTITGRLGGPRTLVISYALIGVAFAGYVLVASPAPLLPLSALKGLGFGLFFVSTVRLIQERTPPEWSATMQAVMNASAFGLAQLVGGPLAGAVAGAFGLRSVFAGSAAFAALAVVVVVWSTLRGYFAVSPAPASSDNVTTL